MITEEYKFNQHKSHILINDIDINKIVVSNKPPFGKEGFKYFIGYTDAKEIRPLCIFFLEMRAYRRDFDDTECISFFIKDGQIFRKIP